MSIQQFPMTELQAEAVCRRMAAAHPSGTFKVVGGNGHFFVKQSDWNTEGESHATIMHGKALERHEAKRERSKRIIQRRRQAKRDAANA